MSKKHNLLHTALADDNLAIDIKFKNALREKILNTKENTTMAEKKHQQLNFKQLTKQKKFIYAGGFALLLVVASTFYAVNNRNDSLAREAEIKDIIELPENLSNVLGVEEMKTLASSDAPAGATITGVEIENEHGAVLYKVKFSDGSFRLYDAVTGLAYVETKDTVKTNESVPADFVPGVSLQQARDIASAKRPGKTITKIELEMEEGKAVYSVRFSDGGRVDVNASDGSVVRIRQANESSTNSSSSDDSGDSNDDSQSSGSGSSSNKDSDDSQDSADHAEEDTEDDGDKSGSDSTDENKNEDSHSGSSNSGSGH
jgi:uncharacterized membrane protein YkoI